MTEVWQRNTPLKQPSRKYRGKYMKEWNHDEDTLLCQKYYEEGVRIESIVPLFNRSYTSIKTRLDLIGEKYTNEKKVLFAEKNEENEKVDAKENSRVTLVDEQFDIICRSFEYIIRSMNNLNAKINIEKQRTYV